MTIKIMEEGKGPYWYFLAWILARYRELTSKSSITFSELEELLLRKMWQEFGIGLYRNSTEMMGALKILERFGLIEIGEEYSNCIIRIKDSLINFKKQILERDPLLNDSNKSYLACLREKIDYALNKIYGVEIIRN